MSIFSKDREDMNFFRFLEIVFHGCISENVEIAGANFSVIFHAKEGDF